MPRSVTPMTAIGVVTPGTMPRRTLPPSSSTKRGRTPRAPSSATIDGAPADLPFRPTHFESGSRERRAGSGVADDAEDDAEDDA